MNRKGIIRRNQYCQFKSEIVSSPEYLVVGIDVAKDKHHAFMGSATGKTLNRKLIFENSIEGFKKLLDQTEAVRVRNALSKIVFGLEPTGNYHKPLSRHLIESDFCLVLVTGKAVKDNRRLLDGRWDKNDTKDAANVADLVSRAKCHYYDEPKESIDELRQLLSLRRRLKREEHSVRMRIRNTLVAKYFPELDQFYSASETESLSIIRWCLNPKKIVGMEFDRFFKLVTRSQRGVAQKLRLLKIHQLAADSVGCPMGEGAEYEAALLVEKLNGVRQHLKETEKRMEEASSGFVEYKYLLTIPGFGPYISSKVLASIADPWRFEDRKQILRLAGYDLCANRSGKTSDKAIPVISKNGNGELRYALYQAALIASVRNREIMKYFTDQLRGRERERGIRTKMRVKLAAKLLVIAWTLMKKQEAFNPDYLNID